MTSPHIVVCMILYIHILVCMCHGDVSHFQERVGWRDSSLARRLVLAITDDEYHYALDGKVAAIVNRHDGRCHLDENGFYDHDTVFVS